MAWNLAPIRGLCSPIKTSLPCIRFVLAAAACEARTSTGETSASPPPSHSTSTVLSVVKPMTLPWNQSSAYRISTAWPTARPNTLPSSICSAVAEGRGLIRSLSCTNAAMMPNDSVSLWGSTQPSAASGMSMTSTHLARSSTGGTRTSTTSLDSEAKSARKQSSACLAAPGSVPVMIASQSPESRCCTMILAAGASFSRRCSQR
mmetsp:Transcript_97977/g.245435  ORF Transcript_97977/g.245435 Transcript_97977/m.245435 type:complete len:204 (+) Transcript_97977:1795-2406(+)